MARISLEETLKKTGIMMIDGSMSTALEELGCSLGSRLWTADILSTQPEKIRQVHTDYFEAGADCGITASYQASIPGFLAAGFPRAEAEALIVRAVELFLEARDAWWQTSGRQSGRAYPLCLGAVGPYGAYLADGSEYRGNYGVDDETLLDFHQRRMELLWNAGADLLLLETQPSLHEVLLEAELAENLHADYWISFSCMDGQHICEGDLIADCARKLSVGHPGLKMIGINCTAPEYISALIDALKSATDLPIAIYPNSGFQYDPVTKSWKQAAGARSVVSEAVRWLEQGVSAIGGCCTTDAGHIRRLTELRDSYHRGNAPKQIAYPGQ